MVKTYVGTDGNDYFKANPTNESWHMAGGKGDDTYPVSSRLYLVVMRELLLLNFVRIIGIETRA